MTMNSSGESAAREQWIEAAREVKTYVENHATFIDPNFHFERIGFILSRHYAAREREEWIPVSDAPRGVAILIHVTTSCYPMIATRTQVGWFSAASANCIDESVITHWRPLPGE